MQVRFEFRAQALFHVISSPVRCSSRFNTQYEWHFSNNIFPLSLTSKQSHFIRTWTQNVVKTTPQGCWPRLTSMYGCEYSMYLLTTSSEFRAVGEVRYLTRPVTVLWHSDVRHQLARRVPHNHIQHHPNKPAVFSCCVMDAWSHTASVRQQEVAFIRPGSVFFPSSPVSRVVVHYLTTTCNCCLVLKETQLCPNISCHTQVVLKWDNILSLSVFSQLTIDFLMLFTLPAG